MIHSDEELKCTQDRIIYFEGLVAQFRTSIHPDNFAAMAGGYLSEIQKMHAEVIAYLSQQLSETEPADVVVRYIEKGSAIESIAENASAFPAPRDEEQLVGVSEGSIAVGSISEELQNGRETNEVIAMSDWKARKRAKARAATMSPTKLESKTAAAMLA